MCPFDEYRPKFGVLVAKINFLEEFEYPKMFAWKYAIRYLEPTLCLYAKYPVKHRVNFNKTFKM